MMERGIKRRPGLVGIILICLAVIWVGLFIILPFGTIVVKAFSEGFSVFWQGISNPQSLKSIIFSLFITTVSVALSAIFGLLAAWALAKFRFPGRSLILAILDLPFALSPVLVGILIIVLYGKFGILGASLENLGIQIIFAWPGVLMTTLFIVSPFVVKEILPVLEERGNEEEEAAATLGASGWLMFRRVTFPALRTALFYGLILAAARAAGEFGAANVVSGLVRGDSTTLPIQIEILYSDFAATQAFACSTLFIIFSLISVVLKFSLQRRIQRKEKKS